MAVENISQTAIVRLPRPLVWKCLRDTEILSQCIAGCEQFEADTDNRFRITVRFKLGPLSHVFKGTVMITDIQHESSLKFRRGSYKPYLGSGAFAGSVQLGNDPKGTRMAIDVQVEAPAAILKLVKIFNPMSSQKRLKDFTALFEQAVNARTGTASAS